MWSDGAGLAAARGPATPRFPVRLPARPVLQASSVLQALSALLLVTALSTVLAAAAVAQPAAGRPVPAGAVPPAAAGVAAAGAVPALAKGLALDCRADAQPTAGAYVLHNNQWGRDGVKDAYSQCVGIGPVKADGSVSARWTWSWPAGPNEIKGFPGIGYGAKPGHQAPASTLPRRVNEISVATTRWDTRSTVSGRGQLTFDLWLTRDDKSYSCFDCAPITHEIMIALEPYGGYGLDRNPAWFEGEVRVGRERFRLYKVDGFGSTGWRFIVLQAQRPLPAGRIDLRAVLAMLRGRGLIVGNEYLASVELGSEPVEGRGDVVLDAWHIEVH